MVNALTIIVNISLHFSLTAENAESAESFQTPDDEIRGQAG